MKNHYESKPHRLLESTYKGVKGTKMIDSGTVGPTVAISVCTHGGEHKGLEVLDYLENQLLIQTNLRKGKLIFVLSNIEGYRHSIRPMNTEEKTMNIDDYNMKRLSESRFIDTNMNRSSDPEILNSGKSLLSYEQRRAKELCTILCDVDIHLDIHTFSRPGNNSMLIISNKNYDQYKNVLNLQDHYVGIPEIQVGKPLIAVTEHFGGVGIGMETGHEFDENGRKVGVDNVLKLLHAEGMVTNPNTLQAGMLHKVKTRTFYAKDKIVIGDNPDEFVPSKQYGHCEPVAKGDIIARRGDEELIAEDDYVVILPHSRVTFKPNEEYCYLGKVEE